MLVFLLIVVKSPKQRAQPQPFLSHSDTGFLFPALDQSLELPASVYNSAPRNSSCYSGIESCLNPNDFGGVPSISLPFGSPRSVLLGKYQRWLYSLVAQAVKNLPATQETWFNPWVRKIPCSRKWQPTPVFLPGESHGQRSLAGYSPWGHKELDMTEWLTFSISGNHRLDLPGNPWDPTPCSPHPVSACV